MIEAVNSAISNAQVQRAAAEQVSSAATAVRAPQATEISVPKAPYISPFISLDTNFDAAIIQIRDSDTGDVLRQFPSESTLRARQAAEEAQRTSEQNARLQNQGVSTLNTGQASFEFETAETSAPQQQSVNVAQAQQAASALAASAQTSQIAQATVSVTA